MTERKLTEIADSLGLEVERVVDEMPLMTSFRVYKGAKLIFAGADSSLQEFFVRYERERPGLFVETMYGYRE